VGSLAILGLTRTVVDAIDVTAACEMAGLL
jgi:hypothetical protein